MIGGKFTVKLTDYLVYHMMYYIMILFFLIVRLTIVDYHLTINYNGITL